MNWLAHVFLSKPDIDFRLGNLLADVVRGADRERQCSAFHDGVRCHLAIDAFTDAHPMVKRSKARFAAPHRRFSGILVDVFYDHFLATRWDCFSKISLREFTSKFSAQIADQDTTMLPREATFVLRRIMLEDRLYSYREVSGIEFVLHRLSERLASRFQRTVELNGAIDVLRERHASFEEDFMDFFPRLSDHVATMLG